MAAEQGTLTVRPAVSPNLEAASLENAGAFLRAAGLVFDEITATRVGGHVDLNPDHHTPWGIVHGGVYTTAVESAASRLRSCRASGDPVARTSPPGIMNTPRRCVHAAT